MRDAPIHDFMQLVLAVVVAQQYKLAVGFGLVSLFGSLSCCTMSQAIPWACNMHKNIVFDY